MSKFYVNEEELINIFKRLSNCMEMIDFPYWLENKVERGEIELVEFNHYEVSKLDYKPMAKLVDVNGNIFNLMAIANKVLKDVGKEEKRKEMCDRIKSQAKNYDEALLIIMEYVEVE